VSVSPGSALVFVTAEADNAVYAVDPERKSVKSVRVGPRPRSIAFLPDASRAYVTSENGASVAVVDTKRLAVIKTIDLGKGMRPMGAVASPDGRRVYISTGRSRMVVTIDTSTNQAAGSVEAGVRPWGIAISADGRTIYTANGPSHDLSVIDVETGQVKSKVAVGKGPWGVAVTAAPAGQ
jgi:YVTN family beta-propeller protein